jgi:transcriptional regulator with XRE-family HTH domain
MAKRTTAETFGQRVARLRRTRQWTQRELAQRSGLSRTYLARIELAQQDPTLGTVRKLAAALEVRMADLIEETTK